jgi:hypothetical protein
MISVNVIIHVVVIVDFEKKNRRHYFRVAPRRIGIRSNSRSRQECATLDSQDVVRNLLDA